MKGNWIDGHSVSSASADTIEVVDPATESILETIPAGCTADVDKAVAAASRAHPGWARLSPTQRREHLLTVADALATHREEIGNILTLENGKPLSEALGEVDMAAEDVRSRAELIVHLRTGNQGTLPGQLSFQHRVPRGVAACIVPWNYPLFIGIENVSANIAVGNTVVWKPSEKTPLSSHFIAEHCLSDLPPGVVNLVHGDGPSCGAPLVAHDDIDVVVFVGSERAGRQIAAQCGKDLKKLVLELGGKDALIVDESVDIGAAARMAVAACYANAGQICTSSERVIVQNSVFDEFLARFVQASESLVVGNGMDGDTHIGPLVDRLQFEKVATHVRDALDRGATCHTGGKPLPGKGFFYPPTVLTDVSSDMLLMQEETFGPVAPLVPFDDFQQAVALANDSAYGLAAIVLTESAARAMEAVTDLNVGMLRINLMRGRAPGATAEPYGASGMGHGHGIELLNELTREKSVHWRSSL